MRFTIQLRGEIGRQPVKAPMAAAISPFMIPPLSPAPMNTVLTIA